MTKQEHELMILMFSRINEGIGMITESLKSRGIWTDDDQRAFSHLVHDDDLKLLQYMQQATRDYLKAAEQSGVVTGLEI